jgi:nicotinate-nucleotide pyrophosphorylase (carboxylating)
VGRGDVTTEAIVPDDAVAAARLVARQAGRIAGLEVALYAFRRLDPRLEAEVLAPDGCEAASGASLARLRGRARALLTAERVALNFLSRLSGVATLTARAVAAVAGTRARITDTRKTTPGLRRLEKYAVRMGGGHNHRHGLDDGVLIKDNHIAAAGGITEAVARARSSNQHLLRVEVECDTLAQVDEALASGVEVILLDNMDTVTMAEAVRRVEGRALVEASGGIGLDRLAAVARAGVDFISLGAVTHSAPALDVGLDFQA